MKYNKLGKTNLSVSEIGLGCEHLQGKDYSVIKTTIEKAIANGINILDVFMSEPDVRTNIGNVLDGQREKVIIQGHIGAIWKDGQYTLSRDLNECKQAFEDLLTRLKTSYIDIGMIHFVDTEEDFDAIFGGEIIAYVKELKKNGVIKSIGLCTHEIAIAKRAVETGLVDILMFSLNPAFDLLPDGVSIDDMLVSEKVGNAMQNHIDPDRMELYQICQRNDVAITVMKVYMAGILLNSESSPFGWALTPAQCIHYALTRPSVASVIVGCISPEEIQSAVEYETATDEEKDFSEIFTKKFNAEAKCVYCNHCLPCPARIDIAQVNKYLDLAKGMPEIPATVIAHYKALPANAQDCIACGDCEKRCPFGVAVRQRMEEAKGAFDKTITN